MTTPDTPSEQPPPNDAFTARRDQLHDWAMDISAFSQRLQGFETSHAPAIAIAAIAARMEAQAARNQPDQHPRWKAVLYRSAAWLCLKAAEADHTLIDLAQECLDGAVATGNPEPSQVTQLKEAIAAARDPARRPGEPRPLRLCCLCRISLDWSRHSPRTLHDPSHPLPVPAGYLCSQCEWTQILEEGRPPALQEPELIRNAITRALQFANRGADAHTMDRQLPTEEKALQAVARTWSSKADQTPQILAAIEAGKLVAFGIWPQGQQPPRRESQ